MKKIALLASGTGSNAKKIIEYFKGSENISVACLLSNNASAKALEMATSFNIPTHIISKEELGNPGQTILYLKSMSVDLIVLAGYLKKIPQDLVDVYPNKIINIHPALLPKFGGKGMYGIRVHEAVVAQRESESGMTIHYVNAKYDDGAIIFQAKCPVQASDTAEQVAANVLRLEHKHYAPVVEQILIDN